MTRARPTRDCGVLLHPTSLPGPGPCGTLGPAAHAFVDALARAGQRSWQVLPLGPTDATRSPYAALSSAAGDPRLVHDDGRDDDRDALDAFRDAEGAWLDDWALYAALRDAHDDAPWFAWDAPLRDRDPAALAAARRALAPRIAHHERAQFRFDRQWRALRDRAREHGIAIVGDVPFYVAHDSVDVWVDRDCFALDADGRPTAIAGVPPDYFSETGQRWGNPVYDWSRIADRGFDWWIARLGRLARTVDVIRIDHFRGFEAFWRIPADAEHAADGAWVPGPGAALFDAARDALGPLAIWAEDLGDITPAVDALRDGLGFPGMRVLQFAFDEPDSTHLPEHHVEHAVVYTGTHDNDTAVGWWSGLDDDARGRVRAIAPDVDTVGPADALVDLALGSVARHAVLPLQDVLGLDGGARMNRPGTTDGNWSWRAPHPPLPDAIADRLRARTEAHGRC